MKEQNGRDDSSANGRASSGNRDSGSRTSDMAHEALQYAKDAASDAASTVTYQVKDLLNRQVEVGADYVAHFASTAKLAAHELDQHSPQIAGLVRGVADRIEDYSDELRDQSVDDLVRAASDFTRKQPALVFGLAALAGFFAYRVLKADPAISSPSIQPSDEGHTRSRRSNGV